MMSGWIYRGGAGLASLLGANLAFAQGTLTALNTGSGPSLVTEVRSVFVDANPSLQRLVFDWGFATDETNAPGVFLDSFTVTIQNTNGSLTGVYVVADASGTLVVPVMPGTIFIDPASLWMTGIPYPDVLPARTYQRAFTVNAFIPAEFAGAPLNVYFDLFDNQNALASQAWFNNLAVIPEPGVVSLSIFAGLILLFSRRSHS